MMTDLMNYTLRLLPDIKIKSSLNILLIYSSDNFLSQSSNLNKFNSAIYSQKLIAWGIDSTSPVISQYLPLNVIELLLSIFNKLILSNQLPQLGKSYNSIGKSRQTNLFFLFSSTIQSLLNFHLMVHLYWRSTTLLQPETFYMSFLITIF